MICPSLSLEVVEVALMASVVVLRQGAGVGAVGGAGLWALGERAQGGGHHLVVHLQMVWGWS